jgi:predicted rRNA methylase YqxC with S4 and FtsJ domains
LLDRCGLAPDDPILDAGAGASTFIDHALERGYQRLIAVDLSEVALGQLK